MKSDDEQIKWQRSVIRDEMDELQKQWEKAITEDWRKTAVSINQCTACNGSGMVRIKVVINGTETMATVVCGECGGTGEHEDICK